MLEAEETAASALTWKASSMTMRCASASLGSVKEGGGGRVNEQTIQFVAAVRAARAEVDRVDARSHGRRPSARAARSPPRSSCRGRRRRRRHPRVGAREGRPSSRAATRRRCSPRSLTLRSGARGVCDEAHECRRELTTAAKRERAKGGGARRRRHRSAEADDHRGRRLAGATTARWFDLHFPTASTSTSSTKEYHEYTPHVTRARVSTGDVQRRIRPRHSEYVRHGTVVVEPCQAVMADHIRVGSAGSDGTVLPFDYLIIASGTSYAENIKAVSPSLDYRLRQFAAERKSLEAAERVVIIGGGLIAMETCGEVRDAFPNKELILVCRSTILRKSGPVPHPIPKADWEARRARRRPRGDVAVGGRRDALRDRRGRRCRRGTRATCARPRAPIRSSCRSLLAASVHSREQHRKSTASRRATPRDGRRLLLPAFTYGDRGFDGERPARRPRERALARRAGGARRDGRAPALHRQLRSRWIRSSEDGLWPRVVQSMHARLRAQLHRGDVRREAAEEGGRAHAIDNLRFVTDEELASKTKVKIVTKSSKADTKGHTWRDALRTPTRSRTG